MEGLVAVDVAPAGSYGLGYDLFIEYINICRHK